MMNLEHLSLDELKTLKKNVEKAIAEFAERERAKALAEVEAFARDRGLARADLAALLSGKKKSRAKAAPKYANPEDPTQTWTGRGRHPRWVDAALAAGKTLDDLKI